MRLIDADALVARLESMREFTRYDDGDYYKGETNALEYVIRVVKQADTVKQSETENEP